MGGALQINIYLILIINVFAGPGTSGHTPQGTLVHTATDTMVTTDHLRPSHILLSCLHTPARLSNEHCVDIYFNINIAAIILSPDPLFTYGSPYTLHLGGIYVVYFYETSYLWIVYRVS